MSREEQSLKLLDTKVVVVGQTGVGKTSMVNKYVHGLFPGNAKTTIGAAFMKKTVEISGWKVILQIWDTAGQERFRSMAPMYYRGAHAAILVFDVTDQSSLDNVEGWVEELKTHASEDIIMVLAGNKSDLKEGSSPNENAETYASKIDAQLFETSAKTGHGVEELFKHVVKSLVRQEVDKKKSKQESERNKGIRLDVNAKDLSQNQSQSSCC